MNMLRKLVSIGVAMTTLLPPASAMAPAPDDGPGQGEEAASTNTASSPPAPSGLSPNAGAMAAATADGVSTLIGVTSGSLIEANPFMPSSPAGIVLLTAAKIGMGRYVDRLEPEARAFDLKTLTAVFGGAAVNNVLLLAAAGPVVAAISGVAAGVYLWHNTAKRLTEEKQFALARRLPAPAEETAPPGPSVAQAGM